MRSVKTYELLFVYRWLSLLTRKAKLEHPYLAWFDHLKKFLHEKMFTKTCLMSLAAFDALVHLLDGTFSYDFSKYGFSSSQDPIEADITVATGLAGLPGAHILSLNYYSCIVGSILYSLALLYSCWYLKWTVEVTISNNTCKNPIYTKAIPRDKL